MDRTLPLLVLLAVLAAVAGCVGETDDEADTSNLDDAPADPAPEVGHPATAYAVTPGGNATTVDPGEALPDGVPAPAGIGRAPVGNLFEPTVGVTGDGTLFVSNTGKGEPLEEDPPPDTEYSSILRSTDGGRTWEDVTDSVGPVNVPPNTFDPYVYVDQATDRVYNLDMIGLQCNWVRWSDDEGESWTNNPAGCGQPAFQDHPTLWAGPPTDLQTTSYDRVLYLCANRVADSACSVSLDGGLTWSPWRTVSPGASSEGEFCGGLHAHGTSGPDGTAYLPKGQCGTPTVYVTHDNGLTWAESVVTTDVGTVGHEVAVATDEAGNVYAFWIAPDLQPYLAVSTDRGQTWSDPVDVSPPDVPVTSHPTVAGGVEGRVAVAYIGTEADAGAYEDVPDEATWNGYVTTLVDAADGEPTAFTTTANAEDDPIARGVCGGTRCRAADDAGVGDFIDVTIDDAGRPWAAFVDVCRDACERNGTSPREEGVGLVGTLARGPSLRSVGEPLPPLPGVPASG